MKTIPFLDLQLVNARMADELKEAAARVIKSGWYLNGNEYTAFEHEFAAYTHTDYCIGVGNGLDALTLILTAMKQLEGWDERSEVIVPAHTFIATASAVVRAGLRPVFCDVSETSYLATAELMEKVITPHTKVLLPVHIYGATAEIKTLSLLADKYGLKIVEDAAQAHGAHYKDGRVAGSAGDAAAFSFYPGKNLGALGNGGAVTTSDGGLARRVRALANYGAEKKYHHEYMGCNSRLDEMQAAMLRVKLRFLDEDNKRRQRIARCYEQGITHPDIIKPYDGLAGDSVYHIYPIFCHHRDKLRHYLGEQGIDTLIHYPIPVHKQAAFSPFNAENHPVAEQLAATELSLPISPVLTQEDVDRVIQTLNTFQP